MKNIFVFCAFHPSAQKNYAKSILNAVPSEDVLKCFSAEEHTKLLAARGAPDGFFAWGFRPGPRLLSTLWRVIEPQDLAVGFFSGQYRVVAKVLAKVESETLANTIWTNRPVVTDNWLANRSPVPESWRLIVLLSKPQFIQVSAADLAPHLPGEYRGAMRMNEGRIKKIVEDFGSLENFVHQRLCSLPPMDSNEQSTKQNSTL